MAFSLPSSVAIDDSSEASLLGIKVSLVGMGCLCWGGKAIWYAESAIVGLLIFFDQLQCHGMIEPKIKYVEARPFPAKAGIQGS